MPRKLTNLETRGIYKSSNLTFQNGGGWAKIYSKKYAKVFWEMYLKMKERRKYESGSKTN